jgi:hypothetical protein
MLDVHEVVEVEETAGAVFSEAEMTELAELAAEVDDMPKASFLPTYHY